MIDPEVGLQACGYTLVGCLIAQAVAMWMQQSAEEAYKLRQMLEQVDSEIVIGFENERRYDKVMAYCSRDHWRDRVADLTARRANIVHRMEVSEENRAAWRRTVKNLLIGGAVYGGIFAFGGWLTWALLAIDQHQGGLTLLLGLVIGWALAFRTRLPKRAVTEEKLEQALPQESEAQRWLQT